METGAREAQWGEGAVISIIKSWKQNSVEAPSQRRRKINRAEGLAILDGYFYCHRPIEYAVQVFVLGYAMVPWQ